MSAFHADLAIYFKGRASVLQNGGEEGEKEEERPATAAWPYFGPFLSVHENCAHYSIISSLFVSNFVFIL